MSRRPLVVGLVLALLGSSAVVLGLTGAPATGLLRAGTSVPASGPGAVIAAVPGAGGAVCADAAGTLDPVTRVLLAAPPVAAPMGQDVLGESTDSARGLVLVGGRADELGRVAVGPVAPGGLETVHASVGAEGWVWAGWADHPLVAWQEWTADGAPGQPRGVVASVCVVLDASEWTVIGLRTDGGNEALLRMVNPHPADATFAVTLITPAGAVEPVALRNVSVAAGAHAVVRLNDHLPEEALVSAIVTVGAGRMVVAGLQRAVAGIGDIAGVSAMPALTSAEPTWTLPWLPTGPDVESSVWIHNPGARPVVVRFTAHTSQGSTPPDVLDSIEVGAGAVVAVDGADIAPAGRRVLAVTLTSDTTPIQVAAGVRFLPTGPGGMGLARFVASAEPDAEWLVAGRAASGRQSSLFIVNLDEADARPVVTVTVRADGPEESAPGSPTIRVIEPGVLAPGAVMRVDLPIDGSASWSALVTGGSSLVVARTTFGTEELRPVVMAALPSRLWRVPELGLVGRPLDGWVARFGTERDLRRGPGLASETGEPSDGTDG
jgi:hypothetical protein